MKSQLLQAFEQVDGKSTRRFGGTGLGLTISRNLARAMGGDLSVKSIHHQGSTFTLCLPLVTAQQPEHQTPIETAAAGPRLAGVSVLAVEDDELNRLVLGDMLHYEGANVVHAKSGHQALEHLKKVGSTAFDIALMDVQMPLMDGYEATRHINSVAPSLPVIGLTAHAMTEERERCLAAGMVAHISKPVDQDHLVSVLLQHLPATVSQMDLAQPGMRDINIPLEFDEHRHDSLPGIDAERAMKNLNCDWSSFKKILWTFHKQRCNSSKEIGTLLARGAIEEAREIAHGIKGSSGYLGAWKLHQEAMAMEEACVTGDLDVAMKQIEPFRLSLEEVISSIEKLDEHGIAR